MATFKQVANLSRAEGNLTLWLEYFAFCIMTSLEKTAEVIKNQKFGKELPASFWKLNIRQKQILYYLENPDMKITNKEVQKMHGVSQITASRDLTELTTLGHLFARGKGRSVFYTKV
jgi:Fic family protein